LNSNTFVSTLWQAANCINKYCNVFTRPGTIRADGKPGSASNSGGGSGGGVSITAKSLTGHGTISAKGGDGNGKGTGGSGGRVHVKLTEK